MCVYCHILFGSCLEQDLAGFAYCPSLSAPGWMSLIDRSPGKNSGCVIRPVDSAVPTPVCQLSYGGDNTACHKLWLWHPARHLSALQVSASGNALPSERPMPAAEGSSLQVPTDPGGTTHPICNRGQALRAAHLPRVHGIQRCLCRRRHFRAERTRSGL